MRRINGRGGRRPFARTVTGLRRLCTISRAPGGARRDPPYGSPMIALVAVALALSGPVEGPVAREFAYGPDLFRPGLHRGADFAASPGATVRAACTGRVAWAAGGVVTLRCGPWRVTH